jgi:hypothetical protein
MSADVGGTTASYEDITAFPELAPYLIRKLGGITGFMS